MMTIQQDLKSKNLSLNEANVVAQNHPLRTLMSLFLCYALLMMLVIKEEEEECLSERVN